MITDSIDFRNRFRKSNSQHDVALATGQPNILQVSTYDSAGGAERVAWNLFEAYRSKGYESWMAVGTKRTAHKDVFVIPNPPPRKLLLRVWGKLYAILKPLFRTFPALKSILNASQQFIYPVKAWHEAMGHEYFDYRGTRRLLNLTPTRPTIVHSHNLHGGYFDLRLLPQLSHQVPVIMTLHDAWLTTGHCAHSFSCDRWKTGCGHCPDLNIDPAIRRDGTASNWKHKQRIFAGSHLYVSTPCQWLMQRVKASVLSSAIMETRIIPNGVDLAIFHGGDQQKARGALNLPLDAKILLFAANSIRNNPWKDFRLMKETVRLAAQELSGQNVIFLALGENAPDEHIGDAVIKFVPHQSNQNIIAQYYQASDIYLHGAKIDTFPNTILEALACGCPVVATSVGGIPEQIKSLNMGANVVDTSQPGYEFATWHSVDEATGVLVPPGNASEMASIVVQLLTDQSTLIQLGNNAAQDAKIRFDLTRQVQDYLDWYEDILREFSSHKSR